MIQVQRLCQKIIGAVPHGIYSSINASMPCQNYYRDSRHFSCYTAQNFFTSNARHAQVSNYKINAAFFNNGKSFFSISGKADIIAVHFKRGRKPFPDVFFVINNQNCKFHCIPRTSIPAIPCNALSSMHPLL